MHCAWPLRRARHTHRGSALPYRQGGPSGRDFPTRLLAVVAATAVLLTTAPAPAPAADAPAAGPRTAGASALTGVDAMTATVFEEGQSSFSGLGIRARLHDARLLENVERSEEHTSALQSH